MSPAASLPEIVFTTPRHLPDARKLRGRVAVLDIAFAADGMGTPFAETTGRSSSELGGRLAAWVDHHDHERHVDFAGDPRFVLATKAQHGACPEMVTPELVRQRRPGRHDRRATSISTACTRPPSGSSAASSPTPAPTTTRAPSTRASARRARPARVIDRALRAHFRDDALKHAHRAAGSSAA